VEERRLRGRLNRLSGVALGLALVVAMSACGASGGARTGAGATTPAQSTPSATGPSAIVGKEAPDFSLVDQFNRRHELSDYQGKVVLLTFVSSHCKDICPLTAELLAETQDLMGGRAQTMQLVAVNANYIFRSVASVAKWSKEHAMMHRWLFLTGSSHQLFSVYSDYGVAPGAAHTIVVFLIDPSGKVEAVIPVAMQNGLEAEAKVLAKAVGKMEAN
jgi:cytochrome oxidase Cu insertion factor (SCO1/SenC/PrrC family)